MKPAEMNAHPQAALCFAFPPAAPAGTEMPHLAATSAPAPETVLRPDVLALSAYAVADATGMVKLDAMENPYSLPQVVRDEVARAVATAPVNRYPDPTAPGLKRQLRATMRVPAGIELLLGNGSDEIIQLLALAVARPGSVIVGVEPSFVMFRLLAMFAGVTFAGVPLKPDFSLDEAALMAAIREHRPALMFIAYPNNPTGNLFDRSVIERIVAAAPGLVVLDEAYHAFAGESFIGDLERLPNLVVMRTLSKLGLAGLRLGFLMGRAQWLDQLDKVRMPYNINVLTQLAAEVVLAHADVLEDQTRAILKGRGALAGALSAVRGVTVFPSAANFLLFRVAGATRVYEALKARRILIKNLSAGHPLLADCLRVTVGTPAENQQFLAALETIVAS